jgi:hypothetical protein
MTVLFLFAMWATGASSSVPSEVAVPADNVLAHVLFANGVLSYSCPEVGGTWTLVGAYANLYYSQGSFNAGEDRIGTYDRLAQADSRGGIDRWTLYPPLTESSVVAYTVSSVSQTDGASFALYGATQTEGSGIFDEVTYIQRLFAKNGLPPSGSCTDTTAINRAAYEAEYWFYTAGHMPYSAASSLSPAALLPLW